MTQAIDSTRLGASGEDVARNETATPAHDEPGPQEETWCEEWTEARRAAAFGEARGRLIALASRVLGSRAEAEDVVQDAWFRWRAADAKALRAPHGWLATVTVRLAIDRLRRLRRESAGEYEPAWIEEAAPSAEEAGLRAARLSDALMFMLERLGPLEQAVFVLREAFDCDYAQIGALTGCTNEHCRQIVRRARLRLAREAAPHAAPADKARHARTVERLRDVLHAQDRAGLMDLLGVTATALVAASVAGVSSSRAGHEAPTASLLRAEALSLEGEPGVVLVAQDGELAAWLHLCDGGDGRLEPVVCVAAAGAGRALSAANRAFGGGAVHKLLARIATESSAALTRAATARAWAVDGGATTLAEPLVVA
ncbi:sigma-70 family RNA polymerase sigma factor [Paraburkholderia mimosarum]|uniref:sigma-70 family RNA polymerase sigma factor n=1 Tax=Paraburkholderia mimosarum TaxID=312026 RepID=UPI000411CCE5|nr:sigma-70 family RNA polymerase sigma factor [Paraburkholderia mimosarum]